MKKLVSVVSVLLFASLLSSCADKSKIKYSYPVSNEERRDARIGSLITGYDDELVMNQSNKKKISDLPINIYLWRAALDTVSFMPLASSDAKGGTIITDWYSDSSAAGERFKFNIFILGRDLKVSSLKVTAFKQVKKGGSWQSIKASSDMVREVEDTIFTKARKLKIQATQ